MLKLSQARRPRSYALLGWLRNVPHNLYDIRKTIPRNRSTPPRFDRSQHSCMATDPLLCVVRREDVHMGLGDEGGK